MDLSRLKEPTRPDEMEWRVGQSGVSGKGPWAKLLAYVTNRAIMNRLDDVCGPGNWQNEFKVAPNDPDGKSAVCGIGIQVTPGVWIWKWDGAQNTDIEPVKGGISDSMKRAGVHWGIGRDLYTYGESWATCSTDEPADKSGWFRAKTKDKNKNEVWFWWTPPAAPTSKKPTTKKPATKRTPAPPAPEPGIDYRKVVKNTLRTVCGCEDATQADRCINEITKGMYTTVAELDDPKDAEAIHVAIGKYIDEGGKLEGLTIALEVEDATIARS